VFFVQQVPKIAQKGLKSALCKVTAWGESFNVIARKQHAKRGDMAQV
jgi:hypothetical protein